MQTVELFSPSGIENIWHHNADGTQKYRLDGVEKLVQLRAFLQQDQSFRITNVSQADIDLLLLTHSPEYVHALKTGKPEHLAASSGLLWQPNLAQVFANSTEAMIKACTRAMDTGKAGALCKGGGHHAVRDREFGFNPVNEIVTAIKHLNLKAAVLDTGVHMGNGLQQLMSPMPNTLLVDLWTKALPQWGAEATTDNVLSMKVTERSAYFDLLDRGLERIANFQPDVLLYHSGLDVIATDRLGGIPGFTEQDYLQREERVIHHSLSRNIPIVVVQGGGYVDHSDAARAEQTLTRLVELAAQSYKMLYR